jgi:hypothetical protein
MWIQGPLSLISGLGIFFSIPKTFTGGDEGEGSISAKLARIDYLGTVALVFLLSDVEFRMLTFAGHVRGPLPVWSLLAKDSVYSDSCIYIPSRWIHCHRVLRGQDSNYSHYCSEEPWGASILRCSTWANGFEVDSPHVRTCLRTLSTRLESR